MSRKRLEFRKNVKIAILRRAGWPENPVCEGCGMPLRGKRIDVDHTIECWERPDRTELTAEDGRALGYDCCHRDKSAKKRTEQAKGDRIIETAAGVKTKKGKPMAGTKRSGWKHKLTGEWERRNG